MIQSIANPTSHIKNSRTALVLGATGLVGGHCLDILLQDNAYGEVVALVRRPLAISHPRLRVHVIDFDNPETYAGLVVADDIFCCLGTTIKVAGSQEAFRRVDFEYPRAIAEVGARNGAGQFLLVSGLGAGSGSRIFYNRVKGELEDEVKGMAFRGVHIFQPSLLVGERREPRLGERIGDIVLRLASPLLIGPLRKYRSIKARNVAAAMVTVAKRDITGVHAYKSDRIARIAAGQE